MPQQFYHDVRRQNHNGRHNIHLNRNSQSLTKKKRLYYYYILRAQRTWKSSAETMVKSVMSSWRLEMRVIVGFSLSTIQALCGI